MGARKRTVGARKRAVGARKRGIDDGASQSAGSASTSADGDSDEESDTDADADAGVEADEAASRAARARTCFGTTEEGVGVCCLIDPHYGQAYGAICSGGGAGDGGSGGDGRIPDEFLQMMGGVVSELVDAARRAAMVRDLMDVAQIWLTELCEDDLDTVEWVPGHAARPDGLDGTGDPIVYEIGIDNAWDGSAAGSLIVRLRPGQELNSVQHEMIGVTSKLLRETKNDMDAAKIGEWRATWVPAGLQGLVGKVPGVRLAAKTALPAKLLAHAKELITAMPIKDLMGELRSYKTPPQAVSQVMHGVLLLLGKAKEPDEPKKGGGAAAADSPLPLPEWMRDLKPLMDPGLVDSCLGFDASIAGRMKAWARSKQATKGLTSDEVLKKGSAAVQVFQKWVEACRLVRFICEQLRRDAAATRENAVREARAKAASTMR